MKKFLYACLLVVSSMVHADTYDDAYKAVLQSDVNTIKCLVPATSFSEKELQSLVKIADSVIEKRSTDKQSNHRRPFLILSWPIILRIIGTAATIGTGAIISVQGIEIIKNKVPEELAAGFKLFRFGVITQIAGCAFSLSIPNTFFKRAKELDRLYVNAIEVKALLLKQCAKAVA